MTVTFDGTEIINATYLTRFVKHETVAERSVLSAPLAREDGEVLVSERYGKKVIRLQGVIKGSTQADLENKIDAFTELFSRPEKNLDIAWDTGTRRYVATCTAHAFDRDHFHLSAVPWTAEFVVLRGEGRDTAATTLLNNVALPIAATTGIATATLTFAGSKPPRPVIRLTSDADGVPAFWTSSVRGLEYKNTDTGERIVVIIDIDWNSIVRYVEIDCDQKVVRQTISGASSSDVKQPWPFYGVFPTFAVGANNVQVTAGGIINQSSQEGIATLPTIGFLDTTAITATTDRIAQSFMVPYADTTFQGLTLGLKKTGSPGSMAVRIETDNGNKPSGTLAHANATWTIPAANVTTGTQEITTYSTNRYSLSANTKYWIVVSAASVDGSNLYSLAYGDSLYPTGNVVQSTDSGGTYSNFGDARALVFKVRYGGQPGGLSYSPQHKVTYTKTYL